MKDCDCSETYRSLIEKLRYLRKKYRKDPSEELKAELYSLDFKIKKIEESMPRRSDCTSGNYDKSVNR
jgi:hypothetical protein